MSPPSAKGDSFLLSGQRAELKSDVVSSEQKEGPRDSLQLPQSFLLQALETPAVTATSTSPTMYFSLSDPSHSWMKFKTPGLHHSQL